MKITFSRTTQNTLSLIRPWWFPRPSLKLITCSSRTFRRFLIKFLLHINSLCHSFRSLTFFSSNLHPLQFSYSKKKIRISIRSPSKNKLSAAVCNARCRASCIASTSAIASSRSFCRSASSRAFAAAR